MDSTLLLPLSHHTKLKDCLLSINLISSSPPRFGQLAPVKFDGPICYENFNFLNTKFSSPSCADGRDWVAKKLTCGHKLYSGEA